MVLRKTTINAGHRHLWERSKSRTTKAAGHTHKIDFKKRIALPNSPGGHSHKLTELLANPKKKTVKRVPKEPKFSSFY